MFTQDPRIAVFDGLVCMPRRQAIYQFIRNSLFRIGWGDAETIEDSRYKFLHSPYSDMDVKNLGLLTDLKDTPAMERLKGHTRLHCMVNLSVPGEPNLVHTHPGQLGLLYYANLTWRPEWAGETLFFDDAGQEVIYASAYRPGRVIVFDAETPHAIRTQTVEAPHYRFTVSIFFKK